MVCSAVTGQNAETVLIVILSVKLSATGLDSLSLVAFGTAMVFKGQQSWEAAKGFAVPRWEGVGICY